MWMCLKWRREDWIVTIDMKGRSNLFYVGRDRQTDQLDLPSLSLSSSKKHCFVDLGWLLFRLVVPIKMHFLCTPAVVLPRSPAVLAAGEQVCYTGDTDLSSLAILSSLVLWTGFYCYWFCGFFCVLLVFFFNISIHKQQITKPCNRNLPLPLLEAKVV